ncbi:MAG: S-layer homology domain-containing protein [Candidatus Altimarinota bacterium]
MGETIIPKMGLLALTAIALALPGMVSAQEVTEFNPSNVQQVNERVNNDLPWLKDAYTGNDQEVTGGQGNGTDGGAGSEEEDEDGGLKSQANNCRFRDVKGHRSEKAIEALYDKNVVGGRRPCYFDPNANATRAEAAAVVVRAIEVEIPKEAEPIPFPDTNKKSWNAKYVKAAKDNDIVHGYPDKNYRAEQEVNKVEALKIVTRAFESESAGKSDFSEVNLQQLEEIVDIDLSQWYGRYVQAGLDEQIISENTSYLEPADFISRAELAEMVYQLMLNREMIRLEENPS